METQHEPPGSQIPGHATGDGFAGMYRLRVEPRVGLCTMSRPRAAAGIRASAKVHGYNPADNGFSRHSKNTGRKRAFRRACERIRRSQLGGTWYRGRWITASELQAGKPNDRSGRQRDGPKAAVAQRDSNARLSFLSYNIGGISTDSYDAFVNKSLLFSTNSEPECDHATWIFHALVKTCLCLYKIGVYT